MSCGWGSCLDSLEGRLEQLNEKLVEQNMSPVKTISDSEYSDLDSGEKFDYLDNRIELAKKLLNGNIKLVKQ